MTKTQAGRTAAEEIIQQSIDVFAEFQQSFEGGIDEGASVFICKPLKRDARKGWRKLNLDPDDRLKYGRAAISVMRNFLGREPISLDIDGLDGETTLGVLPKNQLEELASFSVDLPDLAEDRFADIDDAFFNKTKYTAAKFTFSNGKVLSTYHSAGSGLISKPKKGLFGRKHPEGEIELLDDGIFEIPIFPAFFIYEDMVFIENEKLFSSITNFDDAIKQKASEGFDSLKEVSFISFRDEEKIKSVIQDGGREFSRKLAAAYSSGAFERMKFQNVKNLLDQYELDVTYEDDNGQIVLDIDETKRKSRNDLILVISDRCSESIATGDAHITQKGRPLLKRT